MSTPGPVPNVPLAHEATAPDGSNPQTATASKRPVQRAYVILAALGWLAAGFFFWHQSIGREPPPTPPAAQGEDRAKAETEANTTQQKRATAQSALAVTTRLRDEAAQALQEVRERSAGVNKDLAAARSELDDIRQKIAAQNSELATITKRVDTARMRDSRGKKQEDATPRRASPKTAVTAATAAPPPVPAPASTVQERSAAMAKDLAAARSELDDIRRQIKARNFELAGITRRLDTARSHEYQTRKQVDGGSTVTGAIQPAPVRAAENPATPDPATPDKAAPIPIAKPAPDAPSDPTPDAGRKSRKLSASERSSEVIGPGATSNPSDFELHSGRISRTP
jgi:hypothetical protein